MIYFFIIGIIFAGEYHLKNSIERNRTEKEETPVLGGKIILKKYHNKGACLNIGEKHMGFVAVLSLVFSILMLLLFLVTLTQKGRILLKTGLAILLGGAFSNTYDRLHRKYVVDYFSFASGTSFLRGIVFNIADFCIAIGAAITAIVAV